MDNHDRYKRDQDAMFQELEAKEQRSAQLKQALRKGFEPTANRAARLFQWTEADRQAELDKYVRIQCGDE